MPSNMVKKPKKVETFEDEDDDLEEETSSKGSDDAKKKLFKMMAIICGVLVGFLLIIYIASLLMQKEYTYSDLENIMKEAAVGYFGAHSEYLPTEEGKVVQLNAESLVYEERMKPFSEYGVTCNGYVHVEKVGNEYVYTPYLDCGENYATVELYKKVLSDNSVVTSGYGLYSMNNAKVFRGEDVNNYVKLENSLWRIVKVNSDNTLMLIHNEGLHYNQAWDDRYNEAKLYNIGNNQYSTSRIKEYLNRIFTNPNEEDLEVILSDHDKARVTSYTLCVGKRMPTSIKNNNSEECAVTSKNTKFGLLTLSDYLNASVDPNCKNSTNKSCLNYNYLVIDSSWWLATANKENTYSAFMVNDSGAVEVANASQYNKVRPVISLSERALFDKGTGTLEDPYTIR